MSSLALVLGTLGVILVSILWKALVSFVWRPFAISRGFKKQGVTGPEYKLWSGSREEVRRLKSETMDMQMDIHSHNITPRVLPHYYKWMQNYGDTFLYWIGATARLFITDAEMVKQVLSNKFGFYPKTRIPASFFALLGRGLILTEGAEWARHRRIVSPAFSMDKLKILTKQMAECTSSILDNWQEQKQNPIEVNRQFQELTADVISHTAFGSSFSEGKEVFLAQRELTFMIIATILNIDIPGLRFLPTKRNIQRWKLERRMRDTLMRIIQSRLNSKDSGYGNDLLGLMMESSEKAEGKGLNVNEIIDECKTFFFAGHETTSHLLTWTMFLLGTNQNWQERLREEVLREIGTETPNADTISKLKSVNMVLLEALRLYCPVIETAREAAKDMNLGGIMVPKGTMLTIPMAIIHRKKDLWGEDANQFNPLRFENGIAKAAKHPNALLAFSIGPRACVGQNFAMMEAKIVIVMILQRFSFSLSPEYKHMPADMLTLQPQLGLPVIFKQRGA